VSTLSRIGLLAGLGPGITAGTGSDPGIRFVAGFACAGGEVDRRRQGLPEAVVGADSGELIGASPCPIAGCGSSDG
jgi:hypothetical protein